MPRPTPLHLWLPLLVAAVAAPGLSAQSVELRWRFQPGEVLVYEQTTTGRSSTPMGDVSQEQTLTIRQEVLGVAPDGTARLRVTYEALRMSQQSPMGAQSYDSRTDPAPVEAGARSMSAMLGIPLEVSIAPSGDVELLSGQEALRDAMLGAMPPGAAAATMQEMVDEMDFSQMIEQGFQMLPQDPVAPGAEWAREATMANPLGETRSAFRYRLGEVRSTPAGRVAHIEVSGTAGLEPDPSSPIAGMMEVEDGTVSGTMEFDVDRGRMLSSRLDTTIRMSVMGTTMQTETRIETKLVPG